MLEHYHRGVKEDFFILFMNKRGKYNWDWVKFCENLMKRPEYI